MMAAPSPFILLDPRDDVLVCREDVAPETPMPDGAPVREAVPAGHKLARRDIADGAPVLKYGTVIGFASAPIRAGAHVHRHNLGLTDFARDATPAVDAVPVDMLPEAGRARFDGYLRADGQAGTRNYIGVIASVNCAASVCRFIAEHFRGPALAPFGNVDGVVALGHHSGCGMDRGHGLAVLRRTIAGYVRNPNLAGVLLVGLGCEVNQIGTLLESDGLVPSPMLQGLVIQDEGGTRATVERGIAIVADMLAEANRHRRQSLPADRLVVALQCGGSDGYSALTANPALGAAMDILVRHGGTAVLSETPEIWGVEHVLARRSVDAAVAGRLMARIDWWRAQMEGQSNQMTNSPPPGNTAGGISTIFEKSLGGIMKAGTSPLRAVYDYAERITERGFVFMDAPGFDPVAATGQVAGGANLICFTTGRGSVFGCKPVPSLKLATNSAMYARMRDDMDINCGDIIDAGVGIEAKSREIFETILRVASGRATRSEALGIGEAEFVPWAPGVVS